MNSGQIRISNQMDGRCGSGEKEAFADLHGIRHTQIYVDACNARWQLPFLGVNHF